MGLGARNLGYESMLLWWNWFLALFILVSDAGLLSSDDPSLLFLALRFLILFNIFLFHFVLFLFLLGLVFDFLLY